METLSSHSRGLASTWFAEPAKTAKPSDPCYVDTASSVDEWDVSIDISFLDELQGILGRKNVTLPRVIIGGRYIGGAEDIKLMNENCELRSLIEWLPRSGMNPCDSCGGLRFVLYDQCNGSHKVYMEKTGFSSCPACNVNGLIRCHSCYFLSLRHTKLFSTVSPNEPYPLVSPNEPYPLVSPTRSLVVEATRLHLMSTQPALASAT